MSLTIIEQGRCCIDCALVVANAEDGCDESTCPHGDMPTGTIIDANEDWDGEFYHPWRPCPGCGTLDAGTWPTYTVLGSLKGTGSLPDGEVFPPTGKGRHGYNAAGMPVVNEVTS